MMIFKEFDGLNFTGHDVLMHASEGEAKKIMAFFGHRDLLPDFLPVPKGNEPDEEHYLFLLNSEKQIITPMWSYTTAYGGGWNGYGPVGKDIKGFEFDLFEYSYRHFNDSEIERYQGSQKDIAEWPDWERSVFTGRKRMQEEKERKLRQNNPNFCNK